MADGLSDGDRAWMETRFKSLEEKIEKRDASINTIKIDVELLKSSGQHKCIEEIGKHEASSWAHNPYKAGGLIATVLGIFEAAKKFFVH